MMDYQLTKNYILDLWRTNPKKASQILKKSDPVLYDTINTFYLGKTFSEKSWKYVNNKTDILCNHCYKNPCKFLDFRRGYTTYCSTKCTANTNEVIEKRKITSVSKYGVDHFSKTTEYKEKFIETLTKKYGVINPGQIPENKNKRILAKQRTYFDYMVKEITDFSIPNFTFEEYTHVRDKTLNWKCIRCNNTFESSLFGKLPKCPLCFPSSKPGGQSQIEKEILLEIKKFFDGEIIENSRIIIPPKELDLYFPKEKFAIEINGIYWHSDQYITPLYHQKKYQLCLEQNIKLLMITDHEWSTNKELVCRMIKHRLNLTNKSIPARKCIVQSIGHNVAKEFLNKNHLHGYSRSTKHLGLYYNEMLVSVLSFMKKSRFNNKDIEIVRFALDEWTIPGALGKFIKVIQSEFTNSDIITYADLRYGTGEVYIKNKFTETHTTKPGYWYFINKKLYHRLSWTKKKLIKLGYNSNKTEKEIMAEMGALKIYDCGHNHFILRSTNNG